MAVKYADKIVTLTSQGKKIYTENYSINPDKIEVIHNWIDNIHYNFKYDSKCKKLVTVGRFHPEKGYNFVVDIAKKIYEKYPDWYWDIYGDGDEEIMTDLSNMPNIKLKGIVKGIENIFPHHSIYVMTSYYEGLPLVLLEAKQFSLPIVSFDCPTGPSEIIRNNENGFLIDNYNVDLMFEKISLLIEDRNKRIQFSNNASLDIDKFSKPTIIKQWLNLIDSL
ncbi:TPA: glycosyltransferase [Mannheimia haemolytica]|nr:glycosyltransferase [Mannheimia haemolytica]